MTRLPRLKGKELVRALERAASQWTGPAGVTSSSSTRDGRATTVPVHSGETIGPGLLRAILRDVELSVDELADLL